VSDLEFNSSSLTVDDCSLAERLLNGDRESIPLFYDRYSAMLYGTIVGAVSDEKVAGELLQQAVLSVVGNIAEYNAAKESFALWVCKIARSTVAAAVSKNEHLRKKAIQTASNSVSDTTAIGQEQASATVALDLIWQHGYSYAEAAEHLGIGLPELKKRIRTELQQSKKSSNR